jgi:hypothetical protein
MHVCLSASKIWGRPSGFVKYYINVDTSSMHNNTVEHKQQYNLTYTTIQSNINNNTI